MEACSQGGSGGQNKITTFREMAIVKGVGNNFAENKILNLKKKEKKVILKGRPNRVLLLHF